MPLKLNEGQLALLNDPKGAIELATWVLDPTNVAAYVRTLRSKASVLASRKPPKEELRSLLDYMRDSESDTGVIARVINLYRARNRA